MVTREKLRKARLAKGLTQPEMARLLGFRSKSHYCMIERGRRGVSVETALKIASILEQPIQALFDEAEVHDPLTNEHAAAAESV